MNYYSIFVSMKLIHLSFLILLSFLFTACPEIRQENAQEKLFKNNMDLPDLKRVNYHGISFKLSKLFEDSYDTDFVIKDDAMTQIIQELDLNFSAEKFSKSDAEMIKFQLSEYLDNVDAVHDHYVYKRQSTLESYFTSVKKKGPRESGYPSVIQTIEGSSYEDGDTVTYFMGTVDVNDNYYVFQLIGKKQHMGYLYDDFLAILKSVKR